MITQRIVARPFQLYIGHYGFKYPRVYTETQKPPVWVRVRLPAPVFRKDLDLAQNGMMSQHRYAKDLGHCPRCRSANIGGGSFESQGSEVWSEITCDNCGFMWFDEYKFVRYTPSDVYRSP